MSCLTLYFPKATILCTVGMGFFQCDECSKATPEQQRLYANSPLNAIKELEKKGASKRLARYVRAYRYRLIALHNHVSQLWKKLATDPTHPPGTKSITQLDNWLKHVRANLEFELRVQFRPLRGLIAQKRSEGYSQQLEKIEEEIAAFEAALETFEKLLSRRSVELHLNASNLSANTSTELILRCMLTMSQTEINTEPSFTISCLQDIIQIATLDVESCREILPAITQLAWNKKEKVIILSSTAVKWPLEIFLHKLEKQTRIARIQSSAANNSDKLGELRRMYFKNLSLCRGIEYYSLGNV